MKLNEKELRELVLFGLEEADVNCGLNEVFGGGWVDDDLSAIIEAVRIMLEKIK